MKASRAAIRQMKAMEKTAARLYNIEKIMSMILLALSKAGLELELPEIEPDDIIEESQTQEVTQDDSDSSQDEGTIEKVDEPELEEKGPVKPTNEVELPITEVSKESDLRDRLASVT